MQNLAQKVDVKRTDEGDRVKRGLQSKIGDEDLENEARRKKTTDEDETVSEEQVKNLKSHDYVQPEIEKSDEIIQLKPKLQEQENEENDFDNDRNNLDAQRLNNDQKFADNNEG